MNVTQQVSLGDIFRTFLVSPKLKEYAITNFLVCNTHFRSSKTKNITTEMRFVLMSKIYVMGTSRKRYPLDVTLGPF